MLGQASAIKVRNQVSEYPPLSKSAGCFFCTTILAAKIQNILDIVTIQSKKILTLFIFFWLRVTLQPSRRSTFSRSCYQRDARTGRKNADGLLGDAHDAAHVLLETTSWNKRLRCRRAIFHAHFVEDEEEGVLCRTSAERLSTHGAQESDQRSSGGRSWATIVYYLLNNERKKWKDSRIWEFIRIFAAKLVIELCKLSLKIRI